MEHKLYLDIATDLEDQIRDGRLSENQKLASERVMAEQYGVSRNVIREALKVLKEKGLVEIKNYKGGYVKKPNTDDLIQKFEDAVDISPVNSDELLEARVVIEKAIAHVVVEQITEENLEKLKELYVRMDLSMDDVEEYSKYDAMFHYQLAASTNNQVLMLVTTSLNKLSDRTVYLDSSANSEIRKHAQAEHKEMVLAIEHHDIVRFEEAIARHIECIRTHLKT